MFQKYRKYYRLILKRPGIKMNVHKHPILQRDILFLHSFYQLSMGQNPVLLEHPVWILFHFRAQTCPRGSPFWLSLPPGWAQQNTHTDLEMPPPLLYRKHPREPNCSSGQRKTQFPMENTRCSKCPPTANKVVSRPPSEAPRCFVVPNLSTYGSEKVRICSKGA